MRRSLFCAASLFVVLAGLPGCMQGARVIRNDAQSGVVVIPENTNVWPTYYRQQAEDAIRQEHGQSIEIIWGRGSEEVIGQETRNEQRVDRQFIGGEKNPKGEVVKNTNVSTTTDKREYRLEYQVRPFSMTPLTGHGIQQTGATSKPGGGMPAAGRSGSAGTIKEPTDGMMRSR